MVTETAYERLGLDGGSGDSHGQSLGEQTGKGGFNGRVAAGTGPFASAGDSNQKMDQVGVLQICTLNHGHGKEGRHGTCVHRGRGSWNRADGLDTQELSLRIRVHEGHRRLPTSGSRWRFGHLTRGQLSGEHPLEDPWSGTPPPDDSHVGAVCPGPDALRVRSLTTPGSATVLARRKQTPSD